MMLKISIIAIGRLRKGPLSEIFEDYKKRLQWPVTVLELESKLTDERAAQKDEAKRIIEKLERGAFTIILDERGRSLKSLDFAKRLGDLADQGQQHIQFIIGGASGLTDDVRSRANLLLNFGVQTWPHMLARVMLLEQIYRAQQILSNHPYHRE
jgi:23S rRNA (pseudouridine1915-N3)-methyltransferase